ncbi:MAG: hypothetical protein KZQ64_11050 [gamma proteobacterium symbiont of Bathyaustriella thionipta]|nr:hypothetical protein [gamma proteobacterium symbiont of Bathyaustriella thionipta]MCU7949885.1 hypothetical protein [gamma proteobacterium symbiont of Bathyaustriella thionipta]MCU7953912.1 hypothetical protein [gamma proteobacterium symbiont of Bathyaustriella thionipta]MCU7956482.1 hypothetical protein [gamma proteobacterium symbiont of Bathyaustriella thionipta]MCU7965704.1 hypothetical protein [gamma proteobacterium symbiont of Bathyaustriella thionipta]
MEALIPKLFILTAEASVVFFLLLVAVFIFNSKAKRKDIKAVNELISDYTGSKEERIGSIKNHLKGIAFKGNTDEQAEKLYNHEKSVIKEFVTLYLRRDTYRLLDYPDNLIEANNTFLKTSGAGPTASVTAAPEESSDTDDTNSEQTANATILAREQAESNEAHLKELSELRLKNTELNEHLFEALETITALMTEHGKKTGQEVESNSQKILDAIIYLRDKRLNTNTDPSDLAPSPDDDHDEMESFNLEDDFDSVESDDSFSADLANKDATLDDATAVNLGINDELNVDLDTLEDDSSQNESEATIAENNNAPSDVPVTSASEESTAINLEETSASISEEEDPWADALAEQANAEAEPDTEEEDPWAEALAEQASVESGNTDSEAAPEEDDPWAEALAEQEKSEKK